jgi:hypothetical protein
MDRAFATHQPSAGGDMGREGNRSYEDIPPRASHEHLTGARRESICMRADACLHVRSFNCQAL